MAVVSDTQQSLVNTEVMAGIASGSRSLKAMNVTIHGCRAHLAIESSPLLRLETEFGIGFVKY